MEVPLFALLATLGMALRPRPRALAARQRGALLPSPHSRGRRLLPALALAGGGRSQRRERGRQAAGDLLLAAALLLPVLAAWRSAARR